MRDEQSGGVTLDRGMPARLTWHITADRLDGNGAQPPLANVSTYLKRVGYCPHIMLDPFTGETIQYYPATVGARALSRWNEDGAVHIQVEVYFSPGMTRDGKQYNNLTETPCKGVEQITAWAETWGVPRTWPMGEPTWGSNRNPDTWNSRAGHYGHSQVPGEDHTDPGPMPPITGTIGPAGNTRQLLIPEVTELYA